MPFPQIECSSNNQIATVNIYQLLRFSLQKLRGAPKVAPTPLLSLRLASIRRCNHCWTSACNQPTARPPRRRKYGGPRLSTDRHDPCKPLPGLGAEEKYIRILHDFLRNVVSELARSRVIVNYRKNHKMKPFVHVADWCWC